MHVVFSTFLCFYSNIRKNKNISATNKSCSFGKKYWLQHCGLKVKSKTQFARGSTGCAAQLIFLSTSSLQYPMNGDYSAIGALYLFKAEIPVNPPGFNSSCLWPSDIPYIPSSVREREGESQPERRAFWDT